MNYFVLKPETKRILENKYLQDNNLTELELIQKVGQKLCLHFMNRQGVIKQPVMIFAGIGKNGLDAIFLAKELWEKKIPVVLFLVGGVKHPYLDQIELPSSLPLYKIEDQSDLDQYFGLISEASCYIDGLFGIGLNKDISGIFYHLITRLNHQKKKIYAIDIPSGIDSQSGLVRGTAIHAYHTFVIHAYVYGNVINQIQDYEISNEIIDLGIEIHEDVAFYIDDYPLSFDKRKHYLHKYHNGNLLCFSPSLEMMGAISLSAEAAYRSGVGLCQILMKEKDIPYFRFPIQEVFFEKFVSLNHLEDNLFKKDIFLFGPGMKPTLENQVILKVLLTKPHPIVLDAGGIQVFRTIYQKQEHYGNVIMTPHIGELCQFLQIDVPAFWQNPLDYLKPLINQNIKIVLKGNTTWVVSNQKIVLMKSGNPGMAKAGTGDVLAGIIAGLIGQEENMVETLMKAVWLHSLAGEEARKKYGERSLLASDIIKELPHIIQKHTK